MWFIDIANKFCVKNYSCKLREVFFFTLATESFKKEEYGHREIISIGATNGPSQGNVNRGQKVIVTFHKTSPCLIQHSISFERIILCFLFSSELDGRTMGMVWKMMKAFGEKNKVHKNYIFYFEVSKSLKLSSYK